jgi:hypothetical protein
MPVNQEQPEAMMGVCARHTHFQTSTLQLSRRILAADSRLGKKQIHFKKNSNKVKNSPGFHGSGMARSHGSLTF